MMVCFHCSWLLRFPVRRNGPCSSILEACWGLARICGPSIVPSTILVSWGEARKNDFNNTVYDFNNFGFVTFGIFL